MPPPRRGVPWTIPRAALVQVCAACLQRRALRELAPVGLRPRPLQHYEVEAARRMLRVPSLKRLVPRGLIARVRRREAEEAASRRREEERRGAARRGGRRRRRPGGGGGGDGAGRGMRGDTARGPGEPAGGARAAPPGPEVPPAFGEGAARGGPPPPPRPRHAPRRPPVTPAA